MTHDRRHLDLTLSAQQRAAQRAERLEAMLREPVGTDLHSGAALTLRERRVKKLLLQELMRLNRFDRGHRLSYKENKHLDKKLDVAFLDAEIAKMEKAMSSIWRQVQTWLAAAYVVVFGLQAFSQWQDGGHVLALLMAVMIPAVFASVFYQRRALRRKLFIYQALRELSDADEVDVILDRATRQADALIEKLVAEEAAWEARHGQRLRLRT